MSIIGMIFVIISITLPSYIDNSNNNKQQQEHTGSASIILNMYIKLEEKKNEKKQC